MSDAPELLPCPFCQKPLTVRAGVNAYGRCDTPSCWMEARKIALPLDDPEQVRAWNRRALSASPASHGVVTSLDERMTAAGMIPLSKLLAGDTPLGKWEAHAGIRTLAHFEEWLLRRHREFMTMRAAYALGDKDESDELYEWVLAHSGAFSEVVANFRAALAPALAEQEKSNG